MGTSLLLLLLISTFQLTNAVFFKGNLYCDVNSRGNFTANSTYATNLKKLLSTLTSNTEINYGFYNFSLGQNTNKISAIGLCRGDVKPNDCRRRLTNLRTNLTQFCPNQKEAIGWSKHQKSMLRYSDRSIFGMMETEPTYSSMKNVNNASDYYQFNQVGRTQVVRKLFYNLTSIAASGDSRLKYAAGKTTAPNAQTVIYGLVQCTPDLFTWKCKDCLAESTARIPIDFHTHLIGGRVGKPSCNMRFETYPFFDLTLTAPATPTRLNTTIDKTSSQGKRNTTTGIAIAVPLVAIMVVIFICIYLRVRKLRKKFEGDRE